MKIRGWRTRWLRQGLLAACAALGACGGGGGGSGDAGDGPGPSTAAREKPLEIALADAPGYGGLRINIAAVPDGLPIWLGSHVATMASLAQLRRSGACDNAGSSFSLEFDDRNGDRGLSAGDAVQVNLVNCVVGGPGQPPLSANFTADVVRSPTDAAMLALGHAEAWLEIGLTVSDLLDELDAAGGTRLDRPCLGWGSAPGSLSVVLFDRQADGRLGAGDRVDISVRDCRIDTLGGDALSGSLAVELTAAADADTRWTAAVGLSDDVQVSDGGDPVRLAGRLGVTASSARLYRQLEVRSADGPLSATVSIDGRNLTDIVTGLQVTKVLRRDTARATTSAALRVASDVLGGAVELSTDTPFSSRWNVMPDAGRMTIRGAGGRAVSILANPALGTQLQSEIAGAPGLGVVALNALDGLFWSGHGIAPVRGPINVSPSASTSGPAFIGPDGTDVPTRGPLAWQYFEPQTDLASGAVVLRVAGASAWNQPTVAATLTVEGALVTLTPSSPLEPGMRYSLQWPSGEFLYRPLASLQVSDTVDVSVAFTSAAGREGADPQLTGTQAATVTAVAQPRGGRSIARVQWRQVSGPPVEFDTPTALSTSIRLLPPGTDGSAGDAVLEVEVETADGEVDRGRLTVPAIADARQATAVGLRLAGSTARWLRFETNGPPRPGYPSGGTWSTIVEPWRMFVDPVVLFPAAGMATQPGGSYTLTPNTGHVLDWIDGTFRVPGCWGQSGRVDVLQLQAASGAELTRLAVDFTMNCAEGHVVEGWIRMNTTEPIPAS